MVGDVTVVCIAINFSEVGYNGLSGNNSAAIIRHILLPVSILPIKYLPHELLHGKHNASLWGFSPHSAHPFRAQIEFVQ